jgi:threonine aldolase
MRALADRHGLSIHLDGARFFNATTALRIDPQQLTRHVDSVSFCLSKGLCAPVGSVVCGSEAFAKEARRARKILGGGMRQAGVIAAAGVVALNEMVERLSVDHGTACQLAEGLANIPGLIIDPADIKTNIVFFHLEDEIQSTTDEISSDLIQETGIRIYTCGPRLFRAVTHYWVGAREVDLLVNGLRLVMAKRRRT